MMIRTRLFVAASSAALLVGGAGLASSAEAASKPPVFKNCTAMHAKYKHGVGKKGARDRVTSGKPVTNFYVSTTIYTANKRLDRDKDGVACEKH